MTEKNQVLSDDELKQAIAAKYSGVKKEMLPDPHLGETASTPYKFHTEVVSLPSKGVLYDVNSPLSTGKLDIKYMTAKEEDILTSANLIKSGVVIDKLLQSLIVSNINYDDLLVGDKNAVLIASRILAYGKDYEVEITCPACGAKSNNIIDLTAFPEKHVAEGKYNEGINEFTFTLPSNGTNVTFKCLTSADEKAIENELKGLRKLNKVSGIDPEMTTRLKYIITSVDGSSDISTIRKFVDTMLSRDSLALRKYIQEVVPDVKMEFPFECSSCGHEDDHMGMPMTVSFFWPRA
jgi:hypothetical protein